MHSIGFLVVFERREAKEKTMSGGSRHPHSPSLYRHTELDGESRLVRDRLKRVTVEHRQHVTHHAQSIDLIVCFDRGDVSCAWQSASHRKSSDHLCGRRRRVRVSQRFRAILWPDLFVHHARVRTSSTRTARSRDQEQNQKTCSSDHKHPCNPQTRRRSSWHGDPPPCDARSMRIQIARYAHHQPLPEFDVKMREREVRAEYTLPQTVL